MSRFVFYRNTSDVYGNHQQGNLNRIANNEDIIDLPINFESDDRKLNTFSLVDSQIFLNEPIDPTLAKINVFIPDNQNYFNFVAYYHISHEIAQLSNLHKNLVYNNIYLRKNPYGSKNLNYQLDPSINTIFSNSINYLEIKNNKGGIVKRSDNLRDSSSNMNIFITEVSDNLIISRSLGNPFLTYSNVDFSFNQRNFNNLFPSSNIPTELFIQRIPNIQHFLNFIIIQALIPVENIANTYGDELTAEELLKKIYSAESNNWHTGFNFNFPNLTTTSWSRKHPNNNYLVENHQYKAGLYYRNVVINQNELNNENNVNAYREDPTSNNDSVINKLNEIPNEDFQYLLNILMEITVNYKSRYLNQSFFTPFLVFTSNSNNVVFAFYSNYRIYFLCVNRGESEDSADNNEPFRLYNWFNKLHLASEYLNGGMPLIVDFELNYYNYSKLFIGDSEIDQNENVNFFNTIRNVHGQTFNIPSFGVQRIVVDSIYRTQPQLTQLDKINPRSRNLLYGIYSNDTQTDISYLSTEFYNINFNEKSWFLGDKHLSFNQGINIGNLIFTNDTEGHFMYRYCLNHNQDPNLLIETDTSNIPYTILGEIYNGKISFGNKMFEEIENLTVFDGSQILIDFNNNLPLKDKLDPSHNIRIEDPIYEQVCAIAALYFKDSTKNFVYNISNDLIKTINWNDNQYIQKQDSSSNQYLSKYHLIPFNKYFYDDFSQNNTYAISRAQLFLNPLFDHVRSILYSRPEYCQFTTLIGTADISNITINQIMSLYYLTGLYDVEGNLFKHETAEGNMHTLDTQIVGQTNDLLYFHKQRPGGNSLINIYNSVNHLFENLNTSFYGFNSLKRLFLRTDLDSGDISASDTAKFPGNNLIN